MTHFAALLLVTAASLNMADSVFAQETCLPTPERHAVRVDGETSGTHTFAQPVGPGWTFMLRPAPQGWDMRLLDQSGLDLSQITPPYRLAPNPRELYGWHFRNAANTGANTGDVNAPQHVRLFQFSPALTGTGGFKPSAPFATPDDTQGRGILNIIDMGLSDLKPGTQARMSYIKFNACLTWPRSAEEVRAKADTASAVFLDEEREILLKCGLDPETYDLSAWILPRWLEGDLDGDGAIDHAAPIVRRDDQRKGIALCRAETWFSLMGYDAATQKPIKPGYYNLAQYLDKVEYWEIRRSEHGHDEIILGQIEKSAIAIYWNKTALAYRLLWHFIET